MFTALYRPGLSKRLAQWVSESNERVDRFAKWCARTAPLVDSDEEQRADFLNAVAERRVDLERSIHTCSKGFLASIRPLADATLDPDQVSRLAGVELDAARALFEHDIAGPLLARFDTEVAVVRAKPGK